ncbi:c-type cytochrome [Biostraticola tofi]|uniref:Cytochrome c553 n=1 Tax=Biostraticola tofi TaxID=466109 RepID=A0A4V2W5L7_9GAMM|nr:c-type cytochrome [Biostraticola tofi]TCW00306.1 cytochrome c553 [Biostraticola tofi]
MNWVAWLLIIGSTTGVASAWSATGQMLYQQTCSSCHGRNADKQALRQSLPLVTLSREQIVTGLADRRDGQIQGNPLGQRAKAGLTDQQIDDLAGYIRSLSSAEAAQ